MNNKNLPQNCDIVWDLLELASPFEGNYDGWGCANVQ